MSHVPKPESNWGLRDLEEALEQATELLPAQGPLTAFVHHNTLHALEHLPFHQAVLEAYRIYGCQPYMEEEFYREALQRGRIDLEDLEEVLADLESPEGEVLPGLTFRMLHKALLQYPLHSVEGPALDWHLHETGALWRLRREVDPSTRNQLLQASKLSEKELLENLWEACQAATGQLPEDLCSQPPAPRCHRHRDHLLWAGRGDLDEWVNPLLIRFCAAFLDQGQAEVALPNREFGLFSSFLELYSAPGFPAGWLQGFDRRVLQRLESEVSPLESAAQSLKALGVEAPELGEIISQTLLSLKGWAGMLEQNRRRPDRMPSLALPASATEWLAIRLLLEEQALEQLVPEHPPAQIRSAFPHPNPPGRSRQGLAFQLLQVCQFLAIAPDRVHSWQGSETQSLLQAIVEFSPLQRRRLLQLAYEGHFRRRALRALCLHNPRHVRAQPDGFQAIFCLDEREESTRRHLEEVAPHCQTFGTPGYFSLPIYFQALHDPHPVPLCPVSIRPRHLIVEVAKPRQQQEAARRAALRRGLGRAVDSLERGSKSLTLGGLLTSGAGLVAALPWVLRLLFPGLADRLQRPLQERLQTRDTDLQVQFSPENPQSPEGLQRGFTIEEMTEIVRQELENIGLVKDFCPLVLVLGHGSSSLNNPHEAAYDCGACGGGRGGPNARIFASMANHPEVRQGLPFTIPSTTRFVGAYHNTCAEEIQLYDLEHLGPEHLRLLKQSTAALQAARARDALERCRRFLSADLNLSLEQALAHVQERAVDLAQPRPELGHATNALCFLGRRSRTRGLFLDRRAFLCSYDCRQDSEGTILRRLARAVLPVVAGISLEYYFSRVDNAGYGCGSKLPHNITSLLGVMEGFSSDLRTGLPRQMVEVHEPMRALIVIEAPLKWVESLYAQAGPLRQLIVHEWLQLAQIDPDSGQIKLRQGEAWKDFLPDSETVPATSDSLAWFRHHREDLEFAEIGEPR